MIRNELLKYQEQIQNIQWLIYTMSELNDLEQNSIKRLINYIQSKLKLYYYRKTYKNDANYKKLQGLLDQQQQEIEEMYECLKKKNISVTIEDKLLDNLTRLKDMKYTLKNLLFGNLNSELLSNCNIDDLLLLCQNILGRDYGDIDLLYKVVTDKKLYDSLLNYFRNEQKLSELDDCIVVAQDKIASLKLMVDYYDYLVDLQKDLDQLSQKQIPFYIECANSLSEKISKTEKDIEILLSTNNEKNLKSTLISRILNYKKLRSNEKRLHQSLIMNTEYKSQYEINKESMGRCVESLRWTLIDKINQIPSKVGFPREYYIGVISNCPCQDKVVANSELFMLKGYDYETLVKEYAFKNSELQELKLQRSKINEEQKNLFNLFDEQIQGDLLYDLITKSSNIASLAKETQSEHGIRPYIAILILKLIQDTDKLSDDMLEELLNGEDIEYLQKTYETEVGYFLKNEINNMQDLNLDSLIDSHNESNTLSLIKMKIQ